MPGTDLLLEDLGFGLQELAHPRFSQQHHLPVLLFQLRRNLFRLREVPVPNVSDELRVCPLASSHGVGLLLDADEAVGDGLQGVCAISASARQNRDVEGRMARQGEQVAVSFSFFFCLK